MARPLFGRDWLLPTFATASSCRRGRPVVPPWTCRQTVAIAIPLSDFSVAIVYCQGFWRFAHSLFHQSTHCNSCVFLFMAGQIRHIPPCCAVHAPPWAERHHFLGACAKIASQPVVGGTSVPCSFVIPLPCAPSLLSCMYAGAAPSFTMNSSHLDVCRVHCTCASHAPKLFRVCAAVR